MPDNVFSKPYFAQLGAEGIAYVREYLGQGEDFAQLVLSNVNIRNGTTHLNVASQEIKDALDRNHSLHQHAVSDGQRIDTEAMTTVRLEKYRQLDKERGPLVLLGIDNTIESSKKYNHFIPNLPYYVLNDDEWLFVEKISDITVWHTIDAEDLTVGYPNFEYLIPVKDLPGDPKNDHNINKDQMSQLASSVTGIIVGAYHAYAPDTSLLWLKNE